MIVWAGTSSNDVGMIVEHFPKVIVPRRKIEVQTVPGRNGDIIIDQNAFENYEQSYSVFLDTRYRGGLEQAMPKIVDWLLGNTGYQRLEDTYFPDVYRMAYVSGAMDFVSIYNEYGEGTLTFNCQPEKYYKVGEKELTITQGQKLRNPSAFAAYPLIKINGNGSNGTLTFDNKTVTISAVPTTIYINPKLHRAYNGTTNYNFKIIGDYEDLKLTQNTEITWAGGISGVKITPNWWTV